MQGGPNSPVYTFVYMYSTCMLMIVVCSLGPWIDKARAIWTIWRHKVPEDERRIYAVSYAILYPV